MFSVFFGGEGRGQERVQPYRGTGQQILCGPQRHLGPHVSRREIQVHSDRHQNNHYIS